MVTEGVSTKVDPQLLNTIGRVSYLIQPQYQPYSTQATDLTYSRNTREPAGVRVTLNYHQSPHLI